MLIFLRFTFLLAVFFNPLNAASESGKPAAAIVIFGATGDLTAKKLIPALYQLDAKGALADQVAIIGFARTQHTNASFRQLMQSALEMYGGNQSLDPIVWERFQKRLSYYASDLATDSGYSGLKEHLKGLDETMGTEGNRIFYLSIQPSFFPTVLSQLKESQLISDPTQEHPWTRVIVEKPFGSDLASALELQQQIAQNLDSSQVYRMDHYLGKIGLQNILSVRFENILFEQIWNNRHIESVEISLSEQIGIGTRASFWEETGALRDLLQNHVMQLLAFVAMEPPTVLSAEEIHKEKISVLKAIRPFDLNALDTQIIRGQYSNGEVQGQMVPGYFEEEGVLPDSKAETFVAARLWIDNSRWSGVPFYLRAGKRLNKQATEIVIKFKNSAEQLLIRIQPDPGVFLTTTAKNPALDEGQSALVMGYQLDRNKQAPEAYEKLFYEALKGDQSLFVPFEEQEASWELFTPVLDQWKSSQEAIPLYPAGSSGVKTPMR